MTAGVAWIVFGDAGFYFSDQVGTDVSGLGVDAAAQLGKEGDERGTEAESDEFIGYGARTGKTAEGEKEQADAEQRQRDDNEAGDGAATKGDLQSFAEAGACGGGGADVRTDGDEHAGVAGECRADGTDEKADDDLVGQRSGEGRESVSDVEHDGQYCRDGSDGGVLAAHEGFGTFADGIGDGLHLRGAVVSR